MENDDFVVTVRLMELCDIPQVAQIERRVFSQPWSEKAFSDTLGDNNYIYIVVGHEARIIGYIGCIVSADGADITNVAVDEDYRRLGIADRLLKECFALLEKRNVNAVYLEVRESNAGAQKLYSGNGFEQIGLRKNFYRMPEENAILMVKYLQ